MGLYPRCLVCRYCRISRAYLRTGPYLLFLGRCWRQLVLLCNHSLLSSFLFFVRLRCTNTSRLQGVFSFLLCSRQVSGFIGSRPYLGRLKVREASIRFYSFQKRSLYPFFRVDTYSAAVLHCAGVFLSLFSMPLGVLFLFRLSYVRPLILPLALPFQLLLALTVPAGCAGFYELSCMIL